MFSISPLNLASVIIIISKKLIIASIWPVITNGILVGLELSIVTETSFLINFLWVSLGEIVVMAFAYVIFKRLEKYENFKNTITK